MFSGAWLTPWISGVFYEVGHLLGYLKVILLYYIIQKLKCNVDWHLYNLLLFSFKLDMWLCLISLIPDGII